MPLDIFLRIDGIEGESLDAAHPKEIVALSFAWGAAQAGGGTAGGAGGGAGKVQFRELSVVKPVDKASPRLLMACASGQHIRQCVLSARRAVGSGDVLSVRLTDCVIASISDAGSHEAGTLQETITIGFATIAFEYRPQRPDGSFDAPVVAGWNLKTNAPV
jgi:type VI secretion system secreted protein Hcp